MNEFELKKPTVKVELTNHDLVLMKRALKFFLDASQKKIDSIKDNPGAKDRLMWGHSKYNDLYTKLKVNAVTNKF